MPRILIIGNSPAAASAVKEIRRLDAASEITLFCSDQALPYNRSLLPAFAAKDIKEAQLFAAPESFYVQHKVKVVHHESLARISTKRNQITTENKNHYGFDKLLLIDLPGFKVPGLKGHHKKGVFHAFTLSSIKECMKYVPFTDTVLVPVTNITGFNMACALKRAGKDVIMVSETSGLLQGLFDEETASLLRQIVEGKGIRVVVDTLEEILGDAEMKAARLKSGKVMAAEAVVFDHGTQDLKLLAETGLLNDDGALSIDRTFNTLLPGIYACDAMTGDCDLDPDVSMEHGRSAAAHMLQAKDAAYQAPLAWRDFGHAICDGFYGGVIRLQDTGREHMIFDGPQNIFKKVFVVNDCLVGAVWFNATGDKANVRQALTQKISLAGIEDRFLQSANF